MSLPWLLGWWNLIFLVPFGIALIYLALYVSTGLTFGDADADAQTDVDADAHAALDGHDASVDGHDAHHDVHHAFDAKLVGAVKPDGAKPDGAKPDGGSASSFNLFSLIGVGKVPLSLIVMILLLVWGVAGFAATQWLRRSIDEPYQIALLAMPTAAFIALASTAIISRFFGRIFPMNERGFSLAHLVGESGIAVLPITDAFGLARVKPRADGNHTTADIQVPCRVAPGQPPIAANGPLVVLRFDRNERVFYVATPDHV